MSRKSSQGLATEKYITMATVLLILSGITPSYAQFVQTSPSTNQQSTIAASTCRQQLDNTLIGLYSAAFAADGAGIAAEAVGAAFIVTEIPGVVAQGAALGLTVGAYALETDAGRQLPYCEETFAGSVVVTAGGTSVAGNSEFNNDLHVRGGLGVDGGANISGNSNFRNNLSVTGNLGVNSGANIGGGAAIFSGAPGTGNGIIVDSSGVSLVNASGTSSIAVTTNNGVAMVGKGATATLNGASASLLNNAGKGLSITASQTTLTGGTNSSSLTLADSSATLAVGTLVSPEITVINASNTGGATSVMIGGVNNVSNQLLANAAGGTNTIQAATTNTLTAGISNTITASTGSNTIASGAGSVVTNAAGATTGVALTGEGTVYGVSVTGTSGEQTARMTLGQDTRYGQASPVANFLTDAGAPIRVTGVADGRYDFDAVNFSQLKGAYSGIASVAALAAVPNLVAGKRYMLGVGYGNFKGQQAMAAAFRGVVTDNLSVTAGVGFNRNSTTFSAGAGLSW